MMVQILVVVLSLGLAGGAQAAIKTDLQSLLEAKSIKELDLRQRSEALNTNRHASCASELRLHLLPRDCFREIASEKSSERRLRLTRVCVENAKLSRSRLDLGGSQADLPADCQRAVAMRLEDLRYIDESARPETSVMRTSGPDLEDSSLD